MDGYDKANSHVGPTQDSGATHGDLIFAVKWIQVKGETFVVHGMFFLNFT
jgi:hypothetical protein